MDVVEEKVQHLQIRSARFVQPHETLFQLAWPDPSRRQYIGTAQTLEAGFMEAELGDMT
jgi:hypothetical protein